jgi:hypothetical protein
MTGGGWNVACGTVPDPVEAVGTAGTTGVAAGDDATAGAGPAGTLTGGALLAGPELADPELAGPRPARPLPAGPELADPLLADPELAGAEPASVALAVPGGAGASATASDGGPAARVAARRGLRVRRGGAADSPPSPGSLPLAAAPLPGLASPALALPGLASPGLALPGLAVPVTPDGAVPPSPSIPRAVSF